MTDLGGELHMRTGSCNYTVRVATLSERTSTEPSLHLHGQVTYGGQADVIQDSTVRFTTRVLSQA